MGKRWENEKIVYTAGSWDLFHKGHLNIIKKSKKLGTRLIVGVSTDKLITSYKKAPPVIPFRDRKEIIQNCCHVDKTVKQEKLLDINQLKDLNVDVLTIGDDWKNKFLEGLEWAKKQPNIKVVYFPYTKSVSSTKIKDIINGRQVNKSLRDEPNTKRVSLKEKNALITGSSSGIGAEVARKFANEGINIGIHYSSNTKGAKKIKKELSKKVKVKMYNEDFRLGKLNLVRRFIKDFKTIDILVNNAGVLANRSFFELDKNEFDFVFNINTRAPFLLSKEAFKYMKEQNYGKIINVSSFAVKYGMGRNESIHYAASKAALEILTDGLSRIGAQNNITVNTIRPGITNTSMQKSRKDLNERIKKVPLKRLAEPKEIAEMVAYLASEKGNFITGQIISISGGE